MKITTQQLVTLINEETSRLLNEDSLDDTRVKIENLEQAFNLLRTVQDYTENGQHVVALANAARVVNELLDSWREGGPDAEPDVYTSRRSRERSKELDKLEEEWFDMYDANDPSMPSSGVAGWNVQVLKALDELWDVMDSANDQEWRQTQVGLENALLAGEFVTGKRSR